MLTPPLFQKRLERARKETGLAFMVVRGWAWAGVALCGLSLLRFAFCTGFTGRSTKAFLSAIQIWGQKEEGEQWDLKALSNQTSKVDLKSL